MGNEKTGIDMNEILKKHLGLSYYHKHEYLREDILKAMNEYARLIAEKAVEEEIEYSGDQPFGGSFARKVSRRILSRIKQLTEVV